MQIPRATSVGDGLNPLDAERFHGHCRGLREQTEVQDRVAHRLIGNQLVLHVDGELDVVADPHFGHARHRAGVWIG